MWIAVLLAGGRGSRLGGRHKPGITVAGRTLLDRALAAVADADQTVVVGPRTPTSRPVRWTREQPWGGGPVAALAAGLREDLPEPDEIVLLATDLAGVTKDTVDRLRNTLAQQQVDGAVLKDATGRRQWLISAWRPAPLRAALPPSPAGASLHSVLSTLTVADVAELPGESIDIDTPADLDKIAPVDGGPSRPSHW
ncbi:MAG TPA: nucleotidyltransferase family protein [Pseudonocardiaceae bacterium]|nr:nucleotidyltransferase family protein [Pseudonocardiaceae bacterium]